MRSLRANTDFVRPPPSHLWLSHIINGRMRRGPGSRCLHPPYSEMNTTAREGTQASGQKETQEVKTLPQTPVHPESSQTKVSPTLSPCHYDMEGLLSRVILVPPTPTSIPLGRLPRFCPLGRACDTFRKNNASLCSVVALPRSHPRLTSFLCQEPALFPAASPQRMQQCLLSPLAGHLRCSRNSWGQTGQSKGHIHSLIQTGKGRSKSC